MYAPQLADIITDKMSIFSIKSKELFESNYNILFPEKVKCMNCRQLDQYMTLFLELWSITKTRKGFSFVYSFSKNKRQYNSIAGYNLKLPTVELYSKNNVFGTS